MCCAIQIQSYANPEGMLFLDAHRSKPVQSIVALSTTAALFVSQWLVSQWEVSPPVPPEGLSWVSHQSRGMPGLVMDSDLDAFSQYPSHGSFATPASRLIAETRGVA